MVSGEEKGMEGMDEAVILGGCETTLQNSIMMDLHHQAFGQAHRMDSTKTEPWCRPWSLGDDGMSMKVHQL